jgi:hypothetical protein
MGKKRVCGCEKKEREEKECVSEKCEKKKVGKGNECE